MNKIGPYELRGELGRGAMARVWRAWDPNLQREVAIKEPLFDPSLPPDVLDEMGRRFVAEGRAAARLSHPNIVAIYAADVWDGRPAIVMELVEGATLSDILRRGPLTPTDALSVLDQLLDAAGYAHARGVVHRDIKPDNVFVGTDGRVRLADFGVARVDNGATRATMAGAVLGTPGYMSPEQARGDVVDSRSDIFSIGVVAHEMLSGSNPFGSGETTAMLYRIVHEPPAELPPSASEGLPADLRPAIMAALAKDPATRPQTAADFKAMLHGQTPVPVASTAVPVSDLSLGAVAAAAAPSRSTSRWLPYALVGVVCVAVIAFVLGSALGAGGAGGATPTTAASAAAPSKAATATSTNTVSVSFDGGSADSGTMDALEATQGSNFVVPACTFSRTGYVFKCWVDDNGTAYNPGDMFVPTSSMKLTAQWESVTTESAATPVADSTSSATRSPSNSKTAPAASPKQSHAETFPRMWSGTYVGTSSYVGGDHHITRAVAFDLSVVEESGYFEGTCYVGAEEGGPGEAYGTCTISGNVDWNSGDISFQGNYWIDHGTLGDLREYSGTVDFSSQSMGGSAWDVGTGLYETPWNVHAVDQISILQNGSLTTVP